ncbi:MAG: hypothetical protein O2826_05600 [Chloroflexi bacterium]|nr:hypothetical protein [Chloroflexota bacterium]MDA1173979.1 hypothetical protein [Chloroflexota bacterium]
MIEEDIQHRLLLSRVSGGDETAFAELYDLLAVRAYSLALYVV